MQRLKQIDRRIEEMRPGSVSLQYRDAKTQSYPYHQLNRVVGAKKQSEYVSQRNLDTIATQTEN